MDGVSQLRSTVLLTSDVLLQTSSPNQTPYDFIFFPKSNSIFFLPSNTVSQIATMFQASSSETKAQAVVVTVPVGVDSCSSSIRRSGGGLFKCKHCQMSSHVENACPFLNTNCIIPGCSGMMKLLISKTEKNPGRKFLKCDIKNCNGFQWMDEAVLASLGYEVPDQSCYICGDPKHWVKDCKWNSIVCGKNGCKARKVFKVSRNPNSSGRKYLKCFTCKAFEWVNEEATPELQQECAPIQTPTPVQTISKTYAARVVNEAIVDGLCVTFETHISFKRNE